MGQARLKPQKETSWKSSINCNFDTGGSLLSGEGIAVGSTVISMGSILVKIDLFHFRRSIMPLWIPDKVEMI